MTSLHGRHTARSEAVELGMDSMVQLRDLIEQHDPAEHEGLHSFRRRCVNLERMAHNLARFATQLVTDIDAAIAADRTENAVHIETLQAVQDLTGYAEFGTKNAA